MIYAHRGASLELPENTLEAFERGLALGASAIETDGHMTVDGRIVLAHDPTGQRMAGVAARIRESTLSDVRRWDVGTTFRDRDGQRASRPYRVPTFEEALAAFPQAFFNIDAKAPEMVPNLVRLVQRAGAEGRVRIASFQTSTLKRARALGWEGSLGLGGGDLARAMFVPGRVLRSLGMRGDAAQVPERAYGIQFASSRTIARLHELGLRVDFWTIDDPSRARALVGLGADGIVTNDPRAVTLDVFEGAPPGSRPSASAGGSGRR